MKDYKRLTKRENDCVKYAKPLTSNYIGAIYEEQKERDSEIINRLADIEDKIESGELCDREEVRKETAREILQIINDSIHIRFAMLSIAKRYGVDLEEQK